MVGRWLLALRLGLGLPYFRLRKLRLMHGLVGCPWQDLFIVSRGYQRCAGCGRKKELPGDFTSFHGIVWPVLHYNHEHERPDEPLPYRGPNEDRLRQQLREALAQRKKKRG